MWIGQREVEFESRTNVTGTSKRNTAMLKHFYELKEKESNKKLEAETKRKGNKPR